MDNEQKILNIKDLLKTEEGTGGAEKTKPSREMGYSYTREGENIHGFALLDQKTCNCKELLLRLKEDPVGKFDEVAFWADRLTELIKSRYQDKQFDWISNPPANITRPLHLATALTQLISYKIEVPYITLFFNKEKRGHRLGGIASKLRDSKNFEYIGSRLEPNQNVLLVDDFVCTGHTAARMVELVAPLVPFFVFLAKS